MYNVWTVCEPNISWKVDENEFYESWKTLKVSFCKFWKVLKYSTLLFVQTLFTLLIGPC